MLASIFMIYVHTYGIFILVAQNLFFLLQARKNRNAIAIWLICQAVIGLALLPYLFPLLFGAGGINGAVDLNLTGGRSAPSFLEPLKTTYRFIMSPRRERSLESMLVNYAAAGALLVVGTLIYGIRKGKSHLAVSSRELVANVKELPDGKSKFLLLCCWFLCPIMLPFIASFIIAPMYADHYTISAAPAFYLLLAFGIFSIRKTVPLMLTLVVLTIMIMPGIAHYYAIDINEQWREVSAYIDENSGSDDVIVFAPNTSEKGIEQRTFDWYSGRIVQSCGLSDRISDSVAWNDLTQCVSGHEHFWVIIRGVGYDWDDERYIQFFSNPNQTFMHLVNEKQFVYITVYSFELIK
jgi:hypothetical protein